MRDNVTLACTECGQRNHTISKDEQQQPNRLESWKYCDHCGRDTKHRETR
jgi:large subunit ribosomal protein L33